MKAHRTDGLSLFFGVVFALIALVYLTGSYFRLDLPHAGWFIAGGLILFGLVGAIGALVPKRTDTPRQEEAKAAQEDTSDRPMLTE